MENRAKIISLLYSFIAQKPGFDPHNYGDWKSYRQEMRSVTRDRKDAEIMLRQLELMEQSIPEQSLRDAFRAFSGRLSIVDEPAGPCLRYCTGQYFPTEYRKAVCAVLASALWDAKRENMPPPLFVCGDGAQHRTMEEARAYTEKFRIEYGNIISIEERYGIGKQLVPAGDYLRASFKREFGARMARMWFN